MIIRLLPSICILMSISLLLTQETRLSEKSVPCNTILKVNAEEQILRSSQSFCSWELIAPKRDRILFQISTPVSPKDGTFKIYDDVNRNSSVKTDPPINKGLISSTNWLRIEVISDEIQNNDWKISFQINTHPLCNKTVMVNGDGIISSLDEPKAEVFSLFHRCVWYLKAPYKSRLKLEVRNAPFLDFMAATPETSCSFYNFTIYRGLGEKRRNALKTCYFGRYEIIHIKANTATISYMNDFSLKHRNEISIAYFLQFDQNKCTDIFRTNEESSNLTSPLYPHHYPKGLNCSWLISAPEGKRISLFLKEYIAPGTYESMFVYRYRNDCWTSLIIYDGSNHQSPILSKFCESNLISNISMMSSNNKVFIVFVTSDRHYLHPNDAARFLLQHKAVNKTENVNVTEDGGSIISPSYTRNDGEFLNCSWLLTGPEDFIIAINITSITIMETQNCQINYLRVSEMTSNNSREVGKFCGRMSVDEIKIWSNKALVQFHIETEFEGQKFEILYDLKKISAESVSMAKDIYVTNAMEYMSSPRFPYTYLNNFQATWNVIAPKNRRIRLVIERGLLEYSENCAHDYLKIYDGNNTEAQLLGTFCGQLNKRMLVTSGSTAFILFVTDDTITKKGFRLGASLYYEGICNETINIKGSGYISSPYYPLSYPNSANCSWILNAPKYQWIKMYAEQVSIEQTDNCKSDYVAVQCGDKEETKRICGKHNFTAFKCLERAFISFVSDDVIQGKGINMYYSVV